jgi:hypothetical protein
MSEELLKSSLGSTALTPITIELMPDQVPAGSGRPVEGHEQPMNSFEPDTIDNLAQPTTSILVVIIRGRFQMKVEKGLVYPYQTLHDDV